MPSRSAVFSPVDHEVRARLGAEVAWGAIDPKLDAAIGKLLAQPIDRDTAVRIALARNQRLQARYEQLGIAASEVAEATVLPPTEVDFDYKRALDGAGSETEISVIQDVLALLQIGQRRASATAELDAARARAVEATVELAMQVELRFYDHVAAQQELALDRTAFETAVASAELTERQHAAGNVTDLALAREQEQRERLRVEVSRAEQRVADTRAALAAILGLDAKSSWSTVATLPPVPANAPKLDGLDRAASANLDAAALRAEADAAAARHRTAVVRAFVPTLGAGVAAARRDDGEWEVGPAIRIGIPLFDRQQGARARARAEQRRATRELAATELELGAEVAAARSRVTKAFAEARQLGDVVLPLRKRVLDETVLHYNAMNATPFELLIARRDMVDISRELVDAQRRYWRAVAEARALERGGRVRTEESP
ncbi:MAG TPA: TolC family protein [Kofleriaceae bacterium]|nr:TolC family protein [Kofleriaceae bacterium]